jgi:NTP pyrophosphatase (non-canonical NTP hydrolase)
MTLQELRIAVRQRQPEGKVDHHGSERHQVAQAFAQLYQEETGGRLKDLQREIGIWRKRQGFKTSWRNVAEKLMLAVSELAEAMEAYRHLKPEFLERLASADDAPIDVPAEGFAEQIEWHKNFGEELADTLIRLFDLADALDVDLLQEVCWKMAINELRPYKHGKEC